jgi:hypothetical protein
MIKGNRAWTLKEVLVVTFISVVLVGLIWFPQVNSPRKSRRVMCASNLKQIGLAFRVWEGDNGDHYPMQGFTNQLGIVEFPNASNMFRYFQVMSNELIDPRVIICPADSRKAATHFKVLSNTDLSYFIDMDAANESNRNMLLSGDRNLVVDGVPAGPGLLTLNPTNQIAWSGTIHKEGGNVLMADDSVQMVTDSNLQSLLANTGTNVNRLAVP